MKKDEVTRDRQVLADQQEPDREQTEKEAAARNKSRSEDKKTNTRDIHKRARKGYHNDGPGGSYPGY